jgi:hypothetical protein
MSITQPSAIVGNSPLEIRRASHSDAPLPGALRSLGRVSGQRWQRQALAVSALLLGALSACTAPAKATRSFETALPAAESVRVTSRNGALTLRVDPTAPAGRATTAVVARGSSPPRATERAEAVTLETSMDGARLVIEPVFPDGWQSGDGASVEITVPSLRGAVLTTSNGAIVVQGVDGDASASTSNGRVEMAGIAGAATAQSSNGPISLREISGAATASTSNGSVSVLEIAGPLSIRSSNGSVEAEGVLAPIEVRTSNGSVTLLLARDFAGTLELSTSNGSIEVAEELAAPRVRIDRREATIEFATPGPASTARTSNGRITVRQRP